MKPHLKKMVSLLLICIFLLAIILVNTGCEGTESRKAIDDTVNSAAGMDAVEKKEQVKKQLNQIYKNEAEKARKGMEEDGTGVTGNSSKKE
jgi:hypothetical protein